MRHREQSVWFHGTSLKNAKLIERQGFKKGTWFARRMEDAIEFGGLYVFWVNVKFKARPSQWQVCSSEHLPPSSIRKRIDIGAIIAARLEEARKARAELDEHFYSGSDDIDGLRECLDTRIAQLKRGEL